MQELVCVVCLRMIGLSTDLRINYGFREERLKG